MVDQLYNRLARERKHAQFRAEAEAKAKARRLARIRAEFPADSKTIILSGPIGDGLDEFGSQWLRAQLPTDGRPVRLVVHSEGGSLFESLAMHDMLRSYSGRVVGIVGSAAFSAASLLLTACDEVQGTPNSFVMLHNSAMDEGRELSATEQRLLSDLDERMVDLYSQQTGQSQHVIRQMMQAETFLDATEAKRLGFIHSIGEPQNLRIVAKRVSKKHAARVTATARWKAAVDAKAATMPRSKALMAVDKAFPGLREAMIAEANRR